MQFKLTYPAITLLRHVLQNTGEKEEDARGNEIFSPRRLNGEESSQRRHFSKAVKVHLEEYETKARTESEKYNTLRKTTAKEWEKENPKKKKEEQEDYDERKEQYLNTDTEMLNAFKEVNDKIKEWSEVQYEFELTDKTTEVVKKYFKEYSDKVGWGMGDDETIAEIEEVLK